VNYDSPRDIERTIRQLGIRLKKRWGQNFLINRGVREKIVSILDPRPGELVWEIGPGLGSMTELLANRCSMLFLFEIDWKVIAFLKGRFDAYSNLQIFPGDVLDKWKDVLQTRGRPDRIIGNLPYNSAAAIVASFCEDNLLPRTTVFSVQKELARRMTAPPGSKNYSAFSVLCRSTYDIKVHGDISPGSFYPRPSVVSTIVELRPRMTGPMPTNRKLFSALVRASFASRRKTLRNNLVAGPFLEQFDRQDILRAASEEEIDVSKRGEVYSPEHFIRLSNRIS
jgi:16S rRNA (adenine1518-N6/adenine1519-N6)-dimethyltransferase